jgi:ATP-dependent exoDNAse (exonuclease V) beta subunit
MCYDDICILFRRFMSWKEDVSREYALALESRGIAHTLAVSRSFHRRDEVGAVRTALRAIESPDDELSVYATVRTFWGVPDIVLFRFRERHGRLRPFRVPDDDDLDFAEIRRALKLLACLHEERNRRPVATTVHHFLNATQAHAAFALRRSGELVLGNVHRLLDLARDFEASAATSFRSFVEYLEAEAAGTGSPEGPVLERTAGGVQLMTVFRAKGLEFPVVILADANARLYRPGRSDRHINPGQRLCVQRLLGWAPLQLLQNVEEEDAAAREEGNRIAYVAATRARDLLVVNAIGALEYLDREDYQNGWLSPLYPALYPAREERRSNVEAIGFTPKGDATVLARPQDWIGDEDSVRPGTHRVGRGEHTVSWFDPKLLELERPQMIGLDHEDLLVDTVDRAAGRAAYDKWVADRESTLAQGVRPAFTILRMTDGRESEETEHIEVEVVRVVHRARAAGRQFGKVVHALLEDGDAERGARGYARQHGLPELELPAAVEAARAALTHPLIAAASGAERCFRELPVSARLSDGRLVEGRLDLAYFSRGVWTVVDYKTGARQAASEQQLRLYAWTLERATGQPVRAVLLET